MSSNDRPTLGVVILARARGAKSKIEARPLDFVRLPGASMPAGSVALDFTCDTHGGRLMRLWMSRQAGHTTFGGEGVQGAWDNDTSGCGVVMVRCNHDDCRNSARLTNEWLVASFRQVLVNFEAGKGLPIAWFPLSQVGASNS